MWTRRVTTLRFVASRAAGARPALRAFATTPSNDPLLLMRQSFMKRGMCDSLGLRMPDVHWTMSIAFGADDPEKPPNLRTVGVQRISDLGADFVVKHGSHDQFQAGCPVSILLHTGRYVHGEVAEQWRAEGHCESVPLEDIVHVLPEYTIAHMVASKRMEAEGTHIAKNERSVVDSNSHLTEVIQQVRQEKLDKSELLASIKAFRFSPDRMERMNGGPDSILWERWEWTRTEHGDCPEGTITWNNPTMLLAH